VGGAVGWLVVERLNPRRSITEGMRQLALQFDYAIDGAVKLGCYRVLKHRALILDAERPAVW